MDVNELAAALQKKGAHKTLDRKLKTFTENARTLSKPLEKPEADKIKRQIGFSFIKERLRKWDAIVSRNRLNDHQTFPLEQNDVSVDDERTRLFEKFKVYQGIIFLLLRIFIYIWEFLLKKFFLAAYDTS